MNNILQLIKKHEQKECKTIGVVEQGEVSIKSFFANGKEVVYNTIQKGQMFGNNLIFSSNPHYRGDVISEQEAIIFFINKESLLSIMQKDGEFLNLYLTRQSDFSKTLNLKIKLLTISAASDRLIYFLTINKNKIQYKSITKLANELYLTRESLSRTLKKLKENKIINVSKKTITLMVE